MTGRWCKDIEYRAGEIPLFIYIYKQNYLNSLGEYYFNNYTVIINMMKHSGIISIIYIFFVYVYIIPHLHKKSICNIEQR